MKLGPVHDWVNEQRIYSGTYRNFKFFQLLAPLKDCSKTILSDKTDLRIVTGKRTVDYRQFLKCFREKGNFFDSSDGQIHSENIIGVKKNAKMNVINTNKINK